jgi:hypothetical protein
MMRLARLGYRVPGWATGCVAVGVASFVAVLSQS